jgi:hypothetical protein
MTPMGVQAPAVGGAAGAMASAAAAGRVAAVVGVVVGVVTGGAVDVDVGVDVDVLDGAEVCTTDVGRGFKGGENAGLLAPAEQPATARATATGTGQPR